MQIIHISRNELRLDYRRVLEVRYKSAFLRNLWNWLPSAKRNNFLYLSRRDIWFLVVPLRISKPMLASRLPQHHRCMLASRSFTVLIYLSFYNIQDLFAPHSPYHFVSVSLTHFLTLSSHLPLLCYLLPQYAQFTISCYLSISILPTFLALAMPNLLSFLFWTLPDPFEYFTWIFYSQ